MTVTVTVESIRGTDGVELVVERHRLDAPRARVVIVHGYAEHRLRYLPVVEELTAAGLECHFFDLRGHGQSGGQRGHVSRFTDYLDDLQAVFATVPDDLPRFLVGHSLGGLISLSYAHARPQDMAALAVSSPFLHPAFAITRAQATLARVATHVAPRLSIPSGLDANAISRDPKVVEAYRNDPAIFRITTPRWFTEISQAQSRLYDRASEIVLPALFLLGSADAIADHHRGIAVFERLGSPDKTLQVFPGSFHEVFNDVGREAPIGKLVSWLALRA
jgi:alpha-beta hydrolase superfamily lysophospholipase